MNAAVYIKEAWDMITPSQLENCFGKAEIIQALSYRDSPNQDGIQEFSDLLKNCSISSKIDFTTIEEEIQQDLNADN